MKFLSILKCITEKENKHVKKSQHFKSNQQKNQENKT